MPFSPKSGEAISECDKGLDAIHVKCLALNLVHSRCSIKTY